MDSGSYLLIILITSIIFIVIATARLNVHAFLVLLIASLGVGLASGLGAEQTLKAIRDGFGNTLGYIGIIILLGTIIGIFLEKTGAALSMARFILRIVGEKNIVAAISITGYLVSIPIFCDSGYVILSPLNKTLAEQGKKSMAVMAVALSSAMYCTHCLVPPHPGATAASGILGVELGRVILLGLLIAIPGVIIGHLWAVTFAKRYHVPAKTAVSYTELIDSYGRLPHPLLSFGPIVIPVLLIALKSFAVLPSHPFGSGITFSVLSLIGDPISALLIGFFLSVLLVPKWNKDIWGGWISKGIISAAEILAITAAGGAFGNLLRATGIGDFLGSHLSTLGIGFLLPFLIAAALKTAQGSSTVAIITTASIVAPLLEGLGLASGWGPAIAVLSMGAGSMVVSHANDSFFWVVSRFSDLDPSVTFKAYSSVTFLVGLTSLLFVFIARMILL